MTSVFNASAAKPTVNWNWITLSGKDAKDFLHRVTTVHVKALQIGQGTPGCFLSPQGKVRSYFTLWNFEADDYAFEFDAGKAGKWKQELLAVIDQYTFAEKMTLADITGLECRWIFCDPGEESTLLEILGARDLKAQHTLALDEEIRLCHQGHREYGQTWISAWGRPTRLNQWIERALPDAATVQFETLEAWRIRQLSPRVDAEITADTIPLEAGLMDAIGQDKGCYPGQEVIERITALGAPARRLALMEGKGTSPQSGDPILNLAELPIEIGKITSVHDDGKGGFVALGFLRKIHAKEGLDLRFNTPDTHASVIRTAPYVKQT